MGRLERRDRPDQAPSGPRSLRLPGHTLVGRSPGSTLCLEDRAVSAEHAALRWDGSGWVLRDLGSTNGTWVDGEACAPGRDVPLRAGAAVRFGASGPTWVLAEAGPPVAVATELATGRERRADDDLLALPDDAAPQATLYRDARGRWVVERDGAVHPAEDGAELQLAASRWRLQLPRAAVGTWKDARAQPTLETCTFRFTVSQDEEHVQLDALHGEQALDLGARSFNYTLLVLARARAEDAAQQPAIAPAEHGWRYVDDLCRMLGIDDLTLNVHIYRARRQLARAGILGAPEIVARRTGSRQLRLGAGHLLVQPA